MPPALLPCLLSCLLLAACRSAETGEVETPSTAQWVRSWQQRLREHERTARERAEILPRYLAFFKGADPGRWREGADRLRMLEARDEGFVYDRILELLGTAVADTEAGQAARAELVRMGDIVRITRAFDSPDRDKWLAATAELKARGRQGETAAAVKLILKLKSEKALDIAKAREGLVLLGPASIRFLLEALRSQWVRQRVKQRCVDALASFGEQAEEPLRSLLDSGQSHVRYMAVRALGALGRPGSAPALLRALEKEENPLVACAVLDALGRLGDASAAPAVRARLASEDLSVVKFAARAARAMGDKEAVGPLVEALARLQGPKEARVRAEVLDALRALSGKNLGSQPGPWKDWLAGRR